MKLNQRQQELAESALQAPAWHADRKVSWWVLALGIVVVAVLSGPTTALVCIGLAFATVIIFSLEPFTGLILLLIAIVIGAFSLHSQEVLFALAYLFLTIGVGLFWVLRNISFENTRAASLQDPPSDDQ